MKSNQLAADRLMKLILVSSKNKKRQMEEALEKRVNTMAAIRTEHVGGKD